MWLEMRLFLRLLRWLRARFLMYFTYTADLRAVPPRTRRKNPHLQPHQYSIGSRHALRFFAIASLALCSIPHVFCIHGGYGRGAVVCSTKKSAAPATSE